MNAFFCMLDTLDVRETRTIINAATSFMPEQFEAQGHEMAHRMEPFAQNTKLNYFSHFFIEQRVNNQTINLSFDILNCEFTIEGQKKPLNTKPIEIKSALINGFMQKQNADFDYKGIAVHRHNFHLEDRFLPSQLQPLTDNKTPLYDTHEINWNLFIVRLFLHDSITVNTNSRDCRFQLQFPHAHQSCVGAMIRESDDHKLDHLFQIKF
jgi:hypothetical protein